MDKLIALLLVALTLGSIARFEVSPSIFVYPLDIVVAATCILVAFKQSNIFSKLLHNHTFLAFLLFIGFLVIGLLLNAYWLNLYSLITSFLYLLRFVAYFFVFFIALQFSDKDRKKYLLWLTFSGFATVILGFVQYFLYPNLRNLYYLGWDEHLYRMFSTFLDPNFAGAFFVLVFVLLFSFFQKKKQFDGLKITYLVMMVTTFISLLLTYSRGAYMMFGVALITYFLISKQKKMIIVLLAVSIIGILLIPKGGGGEGVNLFRTFSIVQRLESISHGLFIFQESPIYGVGFNSYRYAQKRYGFLDKKWESTHSGAGVSNSYVFLLATSGIIGMLLYLNIWRTIFQNLWRSKDSINIYVFAAVLASTIGVLVHGIFDNTLFYSTIMIWIYLLIGLVMGGKSHE